MHYNDEFSKFDIVVSITAKSRPTYFKELLFPFFQNFLYINCALCD